MDSSFDIQILHVKKFYEEIRSKDLYQQLSNYKYQDLNLHFKGKVFTPKRKVLAFGDPGISYSFSGTTIKAEPWTPTLLDIKKDIQDKTGDEYNFVFINFYPDGEAKMGLHKEIEQDTMPVTIPTLSIGSSRVMQFSRKDYFPHRVTLDSGSLLLMQPPTNEFWSHEIPAEPDVTEPLFTLTFRKLASRKRTFDDCFTIPSSSQESPPTKRLTPQEPLPSDDWLTKMYINSETKPYERIEAWNLNHELTVSLHRINRKLYVNLQHYSSDTPMQRIVMNPITYREFQAKLHQVNTRYETTGIICNNQLAVFSKKGEIVLQQIFHFEHFKLKDSCIKIGYSLLNKLQEIFYNIDLAIKQVLFNVIIPSEILKLSDQLSVPPHMNLKSELFSILKAEFSINVHKLFECDACKIDDPSQLHHDCINFSYEHLCDKVGSDAMLLTNVNRIIDCLKERDILQYFSKSVFDSISYDDVKDVLLPV